MLDVSKSVEELQKLPLPEKVEATKGIISSMVSVYGSDFVIAQSCRNNVLWHIANEVKPGIIGIVILTPFDFQETIDFASRLKNKYPSSLCLVKNTKDNVPYWNKEEARSSECCNRFKKKELYRALQFHSMRCWASGARRDECPSRANLEVFYTNVNGYSKVNPLVFWTEVDEWMYVALNKVEVNPLYKKGYRSIGCQPCTTLSKGDERSGRWVGQNRMECGMHEEVCSNG